MERAAWTDERLDDLAESIRTGFTRVDQDMRDLRTEMGGMRTDLSGQIEAARETVLRVGGAMFATTIIGFLSVLAAILTTS
jgi:hypothetical protein